MKDNLWILAAGICALVVVSATQIGAAGHSSDRGHFAPTGNMTVGRAFHTATLLKDGRVLLAGGSSNDNLSGLLSSAELYNPKTRTFSPTGSLPSALASHTASILLDGRVLIDGGDDNGFTAAAEVYTPQTGLFASTGSMNSARSLNTTTLLSSGPLKGNVLVTGGLYDSAFDTWSTAELYKPGSGTFVFTGSMSDSRSQHTATLLPNGKVLIAGGVDTNGNFLSSAELYNPATQLFEPTGSMNTARAIHTATLLEDGRVLIAGGFNFPASGPGVTLSSAELYDPEAGTFRPLRDMTDSREDFTATRLLDDSVLMTGGINNNNTILSSAELFTRRFEATNSMSARRWFHTATLLLNSRLGGAVLVTGGLSGDTGNALNSAELYVSSNDSND